MVTTQILAKVEAGRLQKAVEGLVSGAYTITVTDQAVTEVRGFVANGDGKEYGVVLAEGHAFCSCPDAMYRKSICKHAVALALYMIRQPQTEQPAPRRLQTGDRVHLDGHPSITGTLVCVSGDTVNVTWDRGGMRLLLAKSVERVA